MSSNITLYVFVFVATVVALIVIKKVTSCLFKMVTLLAIIALLAFVYFIYLQ